MRETNWNKLDQYSDRPRRNRTTWQTRLVNNSPQPHIITRRQRVNTRDERRSNNRRDERTVTTRLNSPLGSRRNNSNHNQRGQQSNYLGDSNISISNPISSTLDQDEQQIQLSQRNLSLEIFEEETECRSNLRTQRNSSSRRRSEQQNNSRDQHNPSTEFFSTNANSPRGPEFLPIDSRNSTQINRRGRGRPRTRTENSTSNSNRRKSVDYFFMADGITSGLEYLLYPQSQQQDQDLQQNSNELWSNISDSTPFVNLSLEQLGILSEFTETLDYIPKHLLVKYRQSFITVLKTALQSKEDKDWIKFFLLQFLILGSTNNKQGQSKNKVIAERLQWIEENKWELFTIKDYGRKHFQSQQEGTNITKLKEKDGMEFTMAQLRSMKKLEKRDISGAMRTLTQDFRAIDYDENYLNSLKSKYVDANDHGLSEAEIEEALKEVDMRDINLFQFTSQQVWKRLKEQSPFTGPGYDKVKRDILWQLAGRDEISDNKNRDELNFLEIYAVFLSAIANATLPNAVLSFLATQELWGGSKPDLSDGTRDYRPICKCGQFRKDAAALMKKVNQSTIDAQFPNLQYAFAKGGAEKVIHLINFAMDQDIPSHDLYKADGSNAFNRLSRLRMLLQIRRKAPQFYRYARAFYYGATNLYIAGSDIFPWIIRQLEGLQQGDPLATFFYALTIQPLLSQLNDILQQSDNSNLQPVLSFVTGFVDDLTLYGHCDNILSAIMFLKSEGPKYGYVCNLVKGDYLMGKREDSVTVNLDHNKIKSLGLYDNIIRVHPTNAANMAQATSEAILDSEQKYGTGILGSHVGTASFRNIKIQQQLINLAKIKDQLIALPHLQSRYLLLVNSYQHKITYLARTYRFQIVKDLMTTFDGYKREIFESVLGVRCLNQMGFEQACLPIAEGGAALGFTVRSAIGASVASAITSYDIIKQHYGYIDYKTHKYYASFRELINKIHEGTTMDTGITINNIMKLKSNSYYTIQHRLTTIMVETGITRWLDSNLITPEQRAWYYSVNDPNTGVFLTASTGNSFDRFTNLQFRTALRWRLFQPITTPKSCICSKDNRIDPHCHHIISGCPKEGTRIALHDQIKDTIASIYKYCGLIVKREERHCFQAIDPDNNLRPDISILNPPNGENQQILDVAIVGPIPGSQKGVLNITLTQSHQPGIHSERREQQKIKKYYECSQDNNLQFIPFVIESSGRLGTEALQHLQQVAKYGAEQRGCAPSQMLYYLRKRISCALHKAIANHINKRLFLSISNQDDTYDPVHNSFYDGEWGRPYIG